MCGLEFLEIIVLSNIYHIIVFMLYISDNYRTM